MILSEPSIVGAITYWFFLICKLVVSQLHVCHVVAPTQTQKNQHKNVASSKVTTNISN